MKKIIIIIVVLIIGGAAVYGITQFGSQSDNQAASLAEQASHIYDSRGPLMGQITDLPACYYMGGKFVDKIPLAALIPLGDPMLMKGLVRTYYKKGFRGDRAIG